MAQSSHLRYNDETDRAHGIAGMAIAMVLLDGEPYLASVNIDAPIGSAVGFTPAFGFSGNPRWAASLAWHELKKQFELTATMIVGNVFCRSYIGSSSTLTNDMIKELKEFLCQEGQESCDLDNDEVDMIYNRAHRYMDRVFTHPAVPMVARRFVSNLIERRSLSAGEVFDLLSDLS